MSGRLSAVVQAIRNAFNPVVRAGGAASNGAGRALKAGASRIVGARGVIVALIVAGGAAWLVVKNPPVQSIERGEVGVRANRLTGNVSEFREGSAWVIPGLHELHRYSLRDQVYRPEGSAHADGSSPFQSVEGLSIGVDLAVRYALDPARIGVMAKSLPDNLNGEIVEPAVQGVIYKIFTRYTVREIFSSKRAEIQQAIEAELKPKLAADGIVLRAVQIGKVDLP
ncbi:MAG TPA: SPFH domain-containing protein, partial [Albitalea sp.]|nr:SPFH domain-containing protein [Albitalea sp.]